MIVNFFQLLCSRLPQNGKQDSDGIMGFLPEDILSETTRVVSGKNRSFYVSSMFKKVDSSYHTIQSGPRVKFHNMLF